MTRLFALLLVFVAVGALPANQAIARGHGGGGHGGGGHHGGEHHGGEHHGGEHHGGEHHAHHANQNHPHHVHYSTQHHHPFSPDWYSHHPHGWGYRHHYANGWGWTNYNTATGWLGLAGAAALTGSAYSAYPAAGAAYPANNTTNVLTSDNDDDNGEDAPLTIYPAAEVAARRAAATAIAEGGQADPESDAKFLSLGVFSLAPQNQKEATAMVQLSVTPEGTLRGTYYDLLSDEDEVLRGSIDKKNQRAAWTVGKKSKTVFETDLRALTQPTGLIAVHYPNGQTRQWNLARFEEDPTKDGDDSESDSNDSDND